MATRLIVFLSVLLGLAISPIATAVSSESLFGDARMRAWAEAWNAGDDDGDSAVLASVLADLRTADPHPLAEMVWVRGHRAWDRLDEVILAGGEALPASLRRAARLQGLADASRYGDILDGVTPETIAGETSLLILDLLSDAASELQRPELVAAATARTVVLQPGWWSPIWTLASAMNRSDASRAAMAAAFAPGTAAGDGPAGPVARQMLAWDLGLENDLDVKYGCYLTVVDAWLEQFPDDASAHAFAGSYRRLQHRRGAALVHLRRSATLFPFRSYVDRAGMCLIDDGDSAAAERLVRAATRGEARDKSLAYARAAQATGHIGEARRVLTDLIASHPEWGRAASLMAQIELDAGRAEEAAEHAARAVADGPDDLVAVERLAEALRLSGKPMDALAALDTLGPISAIAGAGDTGRNLAFQRIQAHEALGNAAARTAAAEQAATAFPNSRWLIGQHAVAVAAEGRLAAAIPIMERSLAVNGGYTWALGRILAWTESESGAAAARERAEQHVEDAPAVELAWQNLFDRTNGADARMAVRERALAANPGRAWAVKDLVDRLEADDRWDAAFEQYDRVIPARPGDAGSLSLHRAWLSVRARSAGVASDDQLRTSLAELDASAVDLAKLATVGNVRSRLLTQLGDIDAAVAAADATIAADPDAMDTLGAFRQVLGAAMPAGRLNHAMRVCVERDPYDASRVIDFVHFSIKWAGSSIEGLRWAEWIRDELPESFRGRLQREYFSVHAEFGDARPSYDFSYGPRTGSLSASRRYVRWFESSRDASQEQEWVDLKFDLEAGEVAITRADGTRERRGFHPTSGKMTLVQSGDVWVRASYGPYGDELERLWSSSGESMTLAYDDARRISRMVMSEGDDLRFTYDEQGRQTAIAVVGHGELRVVYGGDDADPMSVEAFAADGSIDETGDVGIRVQAAFADMQGLVNAMRSPEEVLARFSPDDPTLESLEEAYYACPREEEVPLVMAMARHLMANLDRGAGYAAEAAEWLDWLWYRFQEDEWNDLGAAAEWLTLQHTLDHARFPIGLPADAAEAWGTRRSWLESAVSRTSDAGLIAVLTRIDANPLQTAEPALWLSRSDLDNEGYWRRWGLADLLPAGVLPVARLSAVLMRANGDVVVGTSVGLCVRRDGWWEWFGFDSVRGRFSRTPRGATGTTSAVLSLAESADGSLWVGTADGLCRLAAAPDGGRAAYDAAITRFVTEADGLPSPRITQLAAAGSAVFVGTPRGLVVFDDECRALHDEPVRSLRVAERPAPGRTSLDVEWMISELEDVGGVADEATIERILDAAVSGDSLGPIARAMLLDSEFSFDMDDAGIDAMLREQFTIEGEPETEAFVLAATDTGLDAWEADASAAVRLLDEPVDDATWDSVADRLIVLQGGLARSGTIGEDGSVARLVTMPDQGALTDSGTLRGLVPVRAALRDQPLDATGILTDAGIQVFRDGHYELVRLRTGQGTAGVLDLAIQQDDDTDRATWYVLADDGVHVFEQAGAMHHEWAVHDLVSAPQWGFTFVATGSTGLDVVDHASGEYIPFEAITATQLALTGDGTLYVNDGFDILRYGVGSSRAERLFTAMSSAPVARNIDDVRAIQVLEDGTVWVASGGSVFRWREGEEPTEFCWYVDADMFPARSPYVDSLIVLPDGTIRVACSDEGHLAERGVTLIGGLLEYQGDRFVRIGESEWGRGDRDSLFWRNYTQVGPDRAIVSTTGGFRVVDRGWVVDPVAAGDATYEALHREDARLWLGTRGVQLPGDDLWLFGSARGVIGYRDGVWLDPNRLNRLLPDPHLSRYGSRQVTAVEVDPAGRIYVGTSRGLLVYEAAGDGAGFLFSQGMPQFAVSTAERQKLQAQADVLVQGMLANAEPGDGRAELIRRLVEKRKRLQSLQSRGNGVRLEGAMPARAAAAGDQGEGDGGGGESGPSGAAARAERDELERDISRTLRRLQRDEPSLFQMLELAPLDLAALRRRLPAEQVVVQAIPSANTLYLHVVSRDRIMLREVAVERQELFLRARRAAAAFRLRSQNLRGFEPEPTNVDGLLVTDEQSARTLQADLVWLYDRLLLPVERDLDGFSAVLMCPAGPLMYVPPAALVRDHEGTRSYAGERYTFGVVPDLFMLVQNLDDPESLNDEALVIGDPDGTLPGARAEAESINRRMGGGLLIGDEAVIDRFGELGRDARVVHLATHGRLNAQDPVRSSLTFSDRELMIYEIDALDLPEVELAVLSACESGLGRDGLEYATLARAFIGAGTRTTIATLWKVDDEWSRRLMDAFYEAYADGESPHAALATAQRRLIAQCREENVGPAAWAGYVVFGADRR